MIKELIKLANKLDSKGLTKDADTLDSIIKESKHFWKNASILPERQDSLMGNTVSGCASSDNSKYCEKLNESLRAFNQFTSEIERQTVKDSLIPDLISGGQHKHSRVWEALRALTTGMAHDWFEAIFEKLIPDPTLYNEETDEEDLDEGDLHDALRSVVGADSLKKFDPYTSSGGLFGSAIDLFTPNDDREKTAYGEFLSDLLKSIK